MWFYFRMLAHARTKRIYPAAFLRIEFGAFGSSGRFLPASKSKFRAAFSLSGHSKILRNRRSTEHRSSCFLQNIVSRLSEQYQQRQGFDSLLFQLSECPFVFGL